MFGGDSSKTEKTTNVTTNTTTKINDIGLTGAHATQLAQVLEQGSVSSQAIQADAFKKLVKTSGTNYSQLIGGAGKLMETTSENVEELAKAGAKQQTGLTQGAVNLGYNVADTAEQILASTKSFAGNLLQAASKSAQQIGQQTSSAGTKIIKAAESQSPMSGQNFLFKALPFAALGLVAIYMFARRRSA
jgi:hypothetical protein